jgi:CBS domain-containing protein
MSTPAPPSASSVLATLDHLRRFAPFDRMEREHLLWMAQRLSLAYYAKGEVILSPEQGVATRFLAIKQGVVQGEQNVARAADADAWLELAEGECFPLGALLANRGVSSVYRAKQDTFCYELAAADFHELVRVSPPFQDFCTRRIASLLEQSKQVIQAQYSQSSSEQQSLSSPLSAIIRREPVTCSADTPVRQVLETMHTLGIGSMVVTEGDQHPIGIFTLHDVLNRVALAQLDLDQPISAVMSASLTTLPPQAFAYEAALEMARHGFRHVLVTESGKLVGIISEKDLFTLQRVGLRQISSAIRNAAGLDALKQSAHDIRQLAHNMMAQGVAAEQLTQFISTLNDLLTARIIELECAAADGHCQVGFCWIALGSEGRYEQTLNTDQDNGIIFTVPEGSTPEQVRAQLLPVAKRINAALDACGFPLCKGNIMASNPQWCLSLAEWKETFAGWIDQGDPEALLNASIFFDFRPLFGKLPLADSLKSWLVQKAVDNPRFLHQMAANALRNRPPLGLVRDFVTGEGHTLDLKLNGFTPFVDAARIFSLAVGAPHTNTVQRLRASAAKLKIAPTEINAWIEALHFIQLLRLRLQHQQSEDGSALSNHVDPDSLNDLDRRILKEAFRQARKLQSRLAMDYQL